MDLYPKTSALMIATLLSGCATPYQKDMPWSLTGGFIESEAPGQLKKISFSGNAYISVETAAKYTLYRCAEYAKEHNADYFILYESLMHAAIGRASDKINMGALGGAPFTSTYILLRNANGVGAWHTETILENYHDIVHPAKPAATND